MAFTYEYHNLKMPTDAQWNKIVRTFHDLLAQLPAGAGIHHRYDPPEGVWICESAGMGNSFLTNEDFILFGDEVSSDSVFLGAPKGRDIMLDRASRYGRYTTEGKRHDIAVVALLEICKLVAPGCWSIRCDSTEHNLRVGRSLARRALGMPEVSSTDEEDFSIAIMRAVANG